MKKRITTIIICILFLSGLSLLLYPFIANQWNNYRQKKLINRYEEVVSQKGEEIDYEAEWAKAKAYNDALLPSILPDSFAIAEATGEDETYMSCLNIVDDGMIGMVEIPKINVNLPIYHTTEKEVLEKAVGHLEGSSLPVGGENTHSVVSAHRGLPSATLFTDLDKLEEGDHFLFHVLDDTLCYEVDQITVVTPKETDGLAVQEGEDLITLLTCTPYGVNTDRLLVRGHRVPYVPEEIEEASVLGGVSIHTNYLLWVIVGLAVTIVFILILQRRENKLQQTKHKKTTETDEIKKE